MYKDPEVKKEKQKQFHRAWYVKNQKQRRQQIIERKNAIREWFYRELKPTLSCIHCGENHPSCIEFHHKDPNEKESGVVELLGTSKKKILEEIAKCDALCSNCHNKEHWDKETGKWTNGQT